MIRYALNCNENHRFESWFQSAEAFDKLSTAGLVACTHCGSSKVEKVLMAPSVRPARSAANPEPARPLSEVADPASAAIAAMRKQIEENSDYVGLNFAAEARAIHSGDSPERSIYGEARPEDARRLMEEGVPVAPLPFIPARKTN